MELRGDSDDEDDDSDDEEFDSDDDMPNLIASPSSAKPAAKAAPKPAAKPKTKAAFPVRRVRFGEFEAEDLVDENGMPRDGYDYSKHMKEMGHGKFYSATGRFDVPSGELSRHVELPDDVLPSAEEQDRLLDAITLTTEVMDTDLREALENDAAFEVLDDDFMTQAATEDPNDNADDGFDYDAHIAKLMEAASGVPKYRGDLTDDEEDEEMSDLEDDGDDDFEIDDEARAEEQRALDALFEKTLAEEYDDDQLGELEDDDPETRGKLELEGALLDEIVADFVHVQQEILDEEGKLGNPLRTGNRLAEVLEECERERAAEEDKEDELDGNATDPVEEDDGVAELEKMMERNAYLAPREQERWDCETIVSTYSNLDNHPTVLREAPLKKKKGKKKAAMDAISEAGSGVRTSKIELSRKTGMPLGIFETAKKQKQRIEEEEEHEEREDLGRGRQKGESKEEKRARKAAIKLQKTQRRLEKKETKLAFKEEEQRQSTQTVAGRVAIFKY